MYLHWHPHTLADWQYWLAGVLFLAVWLACDVYYFPIKWQWLRGKITNFFKRK